MAGEKIVFITWMGVKYRVQTSSEIEREAFENYLIDQALNRLYGEGA